MIGRTGLVFVSCSLTYLVSEEICGRFGSFDGRSTARHINALRVLFYVAARWLGLDFDDRVSASLFVGFSVSLETEAR